MSDTCNCGHVRDEHYSGVRGDKMNGDPKHPTSTACTIKGCDCIAYEEAEDSAEASQNE